MRYDDSAANRIHSAETDSSRLRARTVQQTAPTRATETQAAIACGERPLPDDGPCGPDPPGGRVVVDVDMRRLRSESGEGRHATRRVRRVSRGLWLAMSPAADEPDWSGGWHVRQVRDQTGEAGRGRDRTCHSRRSAAHARQFLPRLS